MNKGDGFRQTTTYKPELARLNFKFIKTSHCTLPVKSVAKKKNFTLGKCFVAGILIRLFIGRSFDYRRALSNM